MPRSALTTEFRGEMLVKDVRPAWEIQHVERARERNSRLKLSKPGNAEEERFLAICQDLFRRHAGCASPFEQFICGLVRQVGNGMWPTPDDVVADLEEFRECWIDMRRDAQRFIEAYPADETEAALTAEKKSDAA